MTWARENWLCKISAAFQDRFYICGTLPPVLATPSRNRCKKGRQEVIPKIRRSEGVGVCINFVKIVMKSVVVTLSA